MCEKERVFYLNPPPPVVEGYNSDHFKNLDEPKPPLVEEVVKKVKKHTGDIQKDVS